MATIDVQQLVRHNIRRLTPYSSARHEFTGTAEIFLDANENPYPNGYNRYPDPYATAVLELIREVKGIPTNMAVLGNGSDEIIDLIYRIFCEPTRDEVMILPPTYGMYKVAADIANVGVREVPLSTDFQPQVQAILNAYQRNIKVLWLCSPNNPSGNDFDREHMIEILDNFPGIVVIDEAYIDFTGRASYAELLGRYPNLIIMQTFSKAFGLAGIRLGMAFANPEVIDLFKRVKPPYNVNQLSQEKAYTALQNFKTVEEKIMTIIGERTRIAVQIDAFPFVEHIYPSDANFLLVKVKEARRLYDYLSEKGIVVRDRSKQLGCEGCLRFTVGLPEENKQLFAALESFE